MTTDLYVQQWSDRISLRNVEIRQTCERGGSFDDRRKCRLQSVVTGQVRRYCGEDEPADVIEALYNSARRSNSRIDLQGYDFVILSNHRKTLLDDGGEQIRLDEVRLIYAPKERRQSDRGAVGDTVLDLGRCTMS